jgi:hypothetical protein
MARVFATFAIASTLAGVFGHAAARPEAPDAPGRPVHSICGPHEYGVEGPPQNLGGQLCQQCQLNRLQHVLEESRDRLARGKSIMDSLHGDDGYLDDEHELTILEWLLSACARWANRGMDRIDPLLTAPQRTRFVEALEECNQVIDQTLEAFFASASPWWRGHLIQDLQFEAARQLKVLRADNVRILTMLRRTC